MNVTEELWKRHEWSDLSQEQRDQRSCDKAKLLSVSFLPHPCFNVRIFLQQVCVCGGGVVFSNKQEPMNTHLSTLILLPPWKRHISFQAKLCWNLPPVLWIDLTDGLLFLGWATLSLLPLWRQAGGSVPAASSQHTDKRPETAKPAGQLLRFSLSLKLSELRVMGAQ